MTDPSAVNTRLYDVLEIQPTASPEDIKKAYRRLAMVYHPDKAGPEGAPKFREINAAYSTLSDPNLRAVYDKYGDRGVQYADTTFGETAMHFGGGGGAIKTILTLTVLLAFIFASMLIIFFSFLAAKIDGRVDWTWPQVISPLFVIDGILLIGLIASTPKVISDLRNASQLHPDDQQLAGPHRSLHLLVAYILCAGFIALTITVAVGLDSHDPSSLCWRAYLVPWYVWAGAHCISAWAQAYRGTIEHECARLGVERSALFLWAYRFLDALQGACSVTFAVLVACRIDRVITVNWFVVAIPMFLALFAALSQQIMGTHLIRSAGVGADAGICGFVCLVAMQVICTSGLPLATIIMILSYLEGSGVKMAHALIPIYLIIGCTVLASCCMCCGTALAPAEMFEGEAPAAANEQGASSAEHQQEQQQHSSAPDSQPVYSAQEYQHPHIDEYQDSSSAHAGGERSEHTEIQPTATA
ncbi:DNA-J chaperone, putative [Bodo saltans]|uniref:DNA-J chaperone, putative n=1 Tax=Bodo saltans TaxID=75058 RepID=A0A0S4IL76_BODSA|nr:DNA-J chaperone, putative [Bodo saltans]|eukprot:CUE70477.1 DNA-J chaperone, putative [Bodo saltans]